MVCIQRPAWLEALYSEKFFVGCTYHEAARKNEKNVCCLDCGISICPHCIPSHQFHRLLQVRRYVYHEVVRLEDLQKLIDCSSVQSYTINSSKVVFIKKRPQSRQFKGSGNYCASCERSLQEPFIHCSLGCKVDFALKNNKDLSFLLKRCKSMTLGPDFFTPNEEETQQFSGVDDGPISWSSGSSGSDNVRKVETSLYSCGATRKFSKVSDDDMATIIRRRKGIPRRSPFC